MSQGWATRPNVKQHYWLNIEIGQADKNRTGKMHMNHLIYCEITGYVSRSRACIIIAAHATQ